MAVSGVSIAGALMLAALALAGPARAAESLVGAGEAWARATPSGASLGAVYVSLTNKDPEPDRVTGVTTPVANESQIHEMRTTQGVMHMRRLTEGLALPPGETIRLAPGGTHIMLLALKKPLVPGDSFPMTLSFAKAAPVTVEVLVKAPGAQAPGP